MSLHVSSLTAGSNVNTDEPHISFRLVSNRSTIVTCCGHNLFKINNVKIKLVSSKKIDVNYAADNILVNETPYLRTVHYTNFVYTFFGKKSSNVCHVTGVTCVCQIKNNVLNKLEMFTNFKLVDCLSMAVGTISINFVVAKGVKTKILMLDEKKLRIQEAGFCVMTYSNFPGIVLKSLSQHNNISTTIYNSGAVIAVGLKYVRQIHEHVKTIHELCDRVSTLDLVLNNITDSCTQK